MSCQITINIFDEKDKKLNGLSELESRDLCILYSDIDNYGYGLQSNYEEPDERYYKQAKICDEIIKLAKQLNDLSK